MARQSDILKTVRSFIQDNRLLDDGATVLVGLSGGADSTALLLLLMELGYTPICVHCNFHLRGQESDRDQQFVTGLCNRLGVKLQVCHYDTRAYASDHGVSIEMAARELRYRDFERLMHECGAGAVCIAHHRDDSVETILMNLMRGTGLRGLTGIKPKNGHIVRPLLCVSRNDIEAYLKSKGQEYITDSTNLETDYTRNKVRLKLLPLMREINPAADDAVLNTARHLKQALDIYNSRIDQLKEQFVSTTGDKTVIRLKGCTEGLLFEVLSPMGFNDSQIDDIVRSLDSQPGVKFISATHMVVRDRDSLVAAPLTDLQAVTFGIEDGKSVKLPDGRMLSMSVQQGGDISKDANVATFDMDMIDGPLTARPCAKGDSFVPFGMKGRKLVSDCLTDCKVDLIDRERQLVLTCNGTIVWVMGRRTDNRFRVTEKTATRLILTLK